jgi:vacuolar-type H+-ATPase subunit E/Vma4
MTIKFDPEYTRLAAKGDGSIAGGAFKNGDEKDQTLSQLDQEVEQQPDNAQAMAAIQALLAEADRLLAALPELVQDPVLATTEDGIESDAETLLANWDGDIDNFVQNLEELADKLSNTDLGAGAAELASQATAKANDLREAAHGIKDGAPGAVLVEVMLESGEVLDFKVPITSREEAVKQIVQALKDQLQLCAGQSNYAEEEEPLENEEPPAA